MVVRHWRCGCVAILKDAFPNGFFQITLIYFYRSSAFLLRKRELPAHPRPCLCHDFARVKNPCFFPPRAPLPLKESTGVWPACLFQTILLDFRSQKTIQSLALTLACLRLPRFYFFRAPLFCSESSNRLRVRDHASAIILRG